MQVKHLFASRRARLVLTVIVALSPLAYLGSVYFLVRHDPNTRLGLSGNSMFNRTIKAETIKVERGDTLLLYSDGITEAMNARGEEYGERRLIEILSTVEGYNAVQTQEAILADVNSFLGGTAPQDDMTLVVLRAANA
jgi:sigma-B regulation protein RsbU (phosphoserine phosphatase)